MPTPAAIRMRRLRARQAEGAVCETAYISERAINALIERGLLDPDDLADPSKRAFAIGDLINQLAGVE